MKFIRKYQRFVSQKSVVIFKLLTAFVFLTSMSTIHYLCCVYCNLWLSLSIDFKISFYFIFLISIQYNYQNSKLFCVKELTLLLEILLHVVLSIWSLLEVSRVIMFSKSCEWQILSHFFFTTRWQLLHCISENTIIN